MSETIGRPNGRALRRAVSCLALLLPLLVLGQPSHAGESVLPVTPPGSTDTDQALLPPPGLYGAFVTSPYNNVRHYYDYNGKTAPSYRDVRFTLQLYVPAMLYVYPFKVLGGSVGSTFAQVVDNFNYKVGSFAKGHEFGLGDAYTDLFFWSKTVALAGAEPTPIPMPYGLTVGGGLALIVPDGSYDRKQVLKLGGNVLVVDPNLALTYNSGKRFTLGDNTQISARAFFALPQKNQATHYQSGNIFDVDWSVTEQFGGFRAGVTGYYQQQVSDDVAADGSRPANGGRYATAAVGPVMQYFVPNSSVILKLKFLDTVYHKNFVGDNFVIFTVETKF